MIDHRAGAVCWLHCYPPASHPFPTLPALLWPGMPSLLTAPATPLPAGKSLEGRGDRGWVFLPAQAAPPAGLQAPLFRGPRSHGALLVLSPYPEASKLGGSHDILPWLVAENIFLPCMFPQYCPHSAVVSSLEPSGVNPVSCQGPEFTPRPLMLGPASPITTAAMPYPTILTSQDLCSADTSLHPPFCIQHSLEFPHLHPAPQACLLGKGESEISPGGQSLLLCSMSPCRALLRAPSLAHT